MTNVDPLSILSKKISDYQTPSGWAADPQYEATTNTLLGNIANLRSQTEGQKTRLGEDYTQQTGQAGKQNTQALDALYEKMANQGIMRSGIAVGENTKQTQNYQDVLDRLAQAKSRGLSDIDTNAANMANQWEGQLGQAQADRAARETERERQQAADDAAAKAAKDAADQQRQWMTDLQNKLIQQTQPQPQPTGQMTKPPALVNPAAAVQQAVQQTTSTAPKANQEQILKAQGVLRLAGFDPGPMDGIAGAKTLAALNKYRTTHGLPAAGYMSVDDVDALNAWLNQSPV
jgi:hypothetical protein